MSNAFEVVLQLQEAIDQLNKIMLGGDQDTVNINHVSKPTISKEISDRYIQLKIIIEEQLQDVLKDVNLTNGWKGFATEQELFAYIPEEDNTVAFSGDTGLFYIWRDLDTGWVPQNMGMVASSHSYVEDRLANIRTDCIIHDEVGITYDFAILDDNLNQLVVAMSRGKLLIYDTVINLDTVGISVCDTDGRASVHYNPRGGYVPLNNSFELTNAGNYNTVKSKKYDFLHTLGNGQSLGDGSTSNLGEPTTGQFLSTEAVGGNLMLEGGATCTPDLASYTNASLIPLVSKQAIGKSSSNESPIVNSANALTKRMVSFNPYHKMDSWKTIASYCGKGGASIEYLSTPDRLELVEKVMRDVVQNVEQLGLTISVDFYLWFGNESQYNVLKNTGSTNPFGEGTSCDILTYQNKILKHYDHIVQLARETYAQEHAPYLLFAHQVNHAIYDIRYNPIAIAQWKMSRAYDFVILAVPVYRFNVNNRDNQHLQHDQAWLLGEYCGRAMAFTINSKRKWIPLQPNEVNWQDREIIVNFDIPYGTLKLDAEAVGDGILRPNFGFDIWSGDKLLDCITEVITDGCQVTIKLDDTVIPQDSILTYGRGRNGDIVSGGNLRDSHGDVDFVQAPTGKVFKLHNPCVMFEFHKIGGF